MSGRQCSGLSATPSQNELLVPLASDLRHSLNALVQAYEQGRGPVEQEALGRSAAGRPMTALQVTAFAEARYPAEIRTFLEGLGYQALYRRDLERGLALATGGSADRSPAAAAAARSDRGAAGWAVALRLAVLGLAVAGGALILVKALPKIQEGQEAQERPRRAPAAVASVPLAQEPEASACLQSLRNAATAWCQRALTGVAAPEATLPTEAAPCGDTLSANSETVRLALDRILADGVAYTFGPAEARVRCAAASRRAAPR